MKIFLRDFPKDVVEVNVTVGTINDIGQRLSGRPAIMRRPLTVVLLYGLWITLADSCPLR